MHHRRPAPGAPIARAAGAGGQVPATPAWSPPGGRRATVAALLRQLSRVLGEGERAAQEAEAHVFGGSAGAGEVGRGDAGQEAALTEGLAAEAAHTESLPEAEALLGASLPVTIRIMGARRLARPYLPALARANGDLVAGMVRSGPSGAQLLRLVPCVHRRTIGSLAAAARAGRPLPPSMVAPVMAGHAARVLGTPRLAGPALLRNTALRQRTVAPAGRTVRARLT